jgi:DNA-binding CsgD family transcriptional regulator/PAS domain-containing protein
MIQDDRGFEQLVHEVYDTALAPESLPTLMPKVCAWLGCESSHLGVWNMNRQAMTYSLLPSAYRHVERAYVEHFWKVDIRRRWIDQHGVPGKVEACQFHFEDPVVGRSEFYQDLLIPQMDARYGAGGVLARHADSYVFLIMNRAEARGAYGTEDLQRLERVTPHLQRMIALLQKTDALRQAAHVGGAALDALGQGVMLVDRRGLIKFANDRAQALLRQGQALATRNGRWVAGASATCRVGEQLARVWRTGVPQSFIERVDQGDARAVGYCFTLTPMRADHTPAWCHSAGIDAGADLLMVHIACTHPSPRRWVGQLEGWFKLTTAEARLTMALADGLTVEQYANAAGIKVPTARSQVRAVLEKTQLPSLMALQSMLSRLPGETQAAEHLEVTALSKSAAEPRPDRLASSLVPRCH